MSSLEIGNLTPGKIIKNLILVIFGVLCYLSTVRGLRCLKCSSITEPRLCTELETCQSGEICGVRYLRSDNGDFSYWTGCVPQTSCVSVDTSGVVIGKRTSYYDNEVICQHCCSSDLCNSQGCGALGYPTDRGPLCYECTNLAEPASCHKIAICNHNEKCYVGTESHFGQLYYTTRCETRHACTALDHANPLGRRAVACKHCCAGDLCNAGCTG
ncbi:uncharacterized protein LOC133194914 [Saccostrea echinata]|uniref:uncharacterized protein LOC133194914 n=1 Tax=Saccostrea echinata TaxID=191078 RepID=UPI002A83D247|nr:uncharacterized protein LOC133194914 [Saccostrea echinata]